MLRFRSLATAGCCALAWLLAPVSPATAQNEVKSVTMDAVKKRGQLICGVDTGIPGYAFQDSKGEWQGLDIAYCRALADAILGSPDKIKYIGTTSKVRFSVLQVGRDRRADPRTPSTPSSATPSLASMSPRSISSPLRPSW